MIDKTSFSKASNILHPLTSFRLPLDKKIALLFALTVVGVLVYYFTRIESSLANKAISTKNHPTFKPLDVGFIEDKLKENLHTGSGLLINKTTLFQKAFKAFNDQKLPNDLSIHRLENAPNYLNKFFEENDLLEISFSQDFFEMGNSESSTFNHIKYFADFAAEDLGGGSFGVGFVQEERLVTACPNLADYIVQHNEVVRDGDHPKPVLIKNVWFVLDIPKDIYRAGKLAEQKDLSRVTVLEKPFKIDVLAMALDRIPENQRTMEEKADLKRVRLIVDTVMAAFTLAQQQTALKIKTSLINSGKLGCGDFGHDPRIVGVAQMLVAHHLGINLILHDYTKSEQKKTERLWDALRPEGKTFEQCIQELSKLGKDLPELKS